MKQFLWVCLGGAIGSGIRYLIAKATLRFWGHFFPIGTLLVNLIGSFFLCFLFFLYAKSNTLSPNLQLATTTGLLGGLTTYSAFNYETLQYFQKGEWLWGTSYLLGTLLLCLLFGALGILVAKYC